MKETNLAEISVNTQNHQTPTFLLFDTRSIILDVLRIKCGFAIRVKFGADIPEGTRRTPVAPVAYQVIVEPGVGQFREFEFPRVHTRINSLGLFLVHKLTYLRKARERELATLDEKSTNISGIAEPCAR